MRIVLDTNIWVSGLLLPQSLAGELLQQWQRSHLKIVTSPEILSEIQKVLAYPKIFKRLQWNQEKINQYIETLSFFTEVITLEQPFILVERDLKDSPILTTLVHGQADYLVTGDQDLLSLSCRYPILSLQQFLERAL